MLFNGHLPEPQKADVQIFTRPSTVTATQWMTWRRPPGATMAFIFCVGGGGNGAAGATGASSVGGGGGGSSGHTSLLYPLWMAPDVLYVQVGGPNMLSYVSFKENTTANNILCVSGAAAAGNASGATGGTAGSVAALTNMPMAGPGVMQFHAGQAGATATNAAGVDITWTGNPLCTGGPSGAGSTSATGGGFLAIANSYLSEQRPLPPGAVGLPGAGAPPLSEIFYNFGGIGGASITIAAATGGAGGPGQYGAGGGGGGASDSGTGGAGGRGGDGFVMIISW